MNLFSNRAAAAKVSASKFNKKGAVETITSEAQKDNNPKKKEGVVPGTQTSTVTVKAQPVSVEQKAEKKDPVKRVILKSDITKKAAEQEIESFQQIARFEDGLKSVISTIGIHDIRPGETFPVKNLGKLFNGDYTTLQVNHEWSNGVWNCSLDVIRASLKNQKSKTKT